MRTSFFQDQKRILSEIPHALEEQSHETNKTHECVNPAFFSYNDRALGENVHYAAMHYSPRTLMMNKWKKNTKG